MSAAAGTFVHGVYCAAATPVTAEGAPDYALFAAHCHTLLEEGCHGIALLGTTGEASSFSLTERQKLLGSVIEAGIDPSRLLPGTSQNNVPDAVALTRHAVDAGAKAAVILPPFYYKGVSDEGLFRFYAEVIEGVGCEALKVLLYHIPPTSQIGISHELIARLRDAFPGVVVGIKDSSGQLDSMCSFAGSFDDFAVFSGADPYMLPLLQAGGAGCITSTSNLIAGDLRTVFDGWTDPTRAEAVERAQARIDSWRTLSNTYVQLPTIKAMLARRRGRPGWSRVRPPLVELSDSEKHDIWARMRALEDAGHD